jgi:hypothetical protein
MSGAAGRAEDEHWLICGNEQDRYYRSADPHPERGVSGSSTHVRIDRRAQQAPRGPDEIASRVRSPVFTDHQ